jgi:hypothetical protein
VAEQVEQEVLVVEVMEQPLLLMELMELLIQVAAVAVEIIQDSQMEKLVVVA